MPKQKSVSAASANAGSHAAAIGKASRARRRKIDALAPSYKRDGRIFPWSVEAVGPEQKFQRIRDDTTASERMQAWRELFAMTASE